MNLDEQAVTGKVLFVDDELKILRTLQRLFVPHDLQVLTASSGAEGLELLSKNKIDVVVSDMRMPEMDGAQFLQEVAQRWPETKRFLLTGYADIESAISAINHGKIDLYINKPWQDNELETAVMNAIESKLLLEKNQLLEGQLKEKNQELLALNASLEEKVEQRTEELKSAYTKLRSTYQSSIQVFSTLVEMYEGEAQSNCRQIAEYAMQTAEKMSLPEDEVHAIYFASLLRSLGKIGMDPALLKKPYNEMSAEERAAFQRYPLLGEAALMAVEPLRKVATIIRSHREFFGGGGYPDNISGEAIPIGARVLSVSVDYSELQQGLLFNKKLLAKQALQYIQSVDHVRYDPKVLATFVEVANNFPEEHEKLQESVLSVYSLQAGMVLSQDLVTVHGMLLLPKGHCLTQHQISTLRHLEGLEGLLVHVIPSSAQ